MKELSVINCSCFAICRFRQCVYPSQTPQFTYSFTPGAYALCGQIDNGGWAFTYSLTSIHKEDVCIYEPTRIICDGTERTLSEIQSLSHYIGDYTTNEDISAKEQFNQLSCPQVPFKKLKDSFSLTDERFNRPLSTTGNEIWRITTALGLAKGKKIFCCPWLSNYQLAPLVYTMKKLSQILAEEGCILLLPVENTSLVGEFVQGVLDLSIR